MHSRNWSFLVFQTLYSIKHSDDWEKLEELTSLQNPVEELRLQDQLFKKFHEILEKLSETVTDTIKISSKDLTKTRIKISQENNKALAFLNVKVLELMNDRSLLASYLLSPSSKITNPENTSQFKLVKNPN